MKDSALYLEVDEDITSAIDKLSKSGADSVQIVVPKRSTMLQSVINLKLLKKAAEGSGKTIVLVTGDRIATDLAARVGLAVAPSIGGKPVLAEVKVPEELQNNEEVIDADDPEPEPNPDAQTPPAAAAAAAAAVGATAAAKGSRFKRPFMKRMPVSDGPPPQNPLEAPAAAASAAVGAAASAATAATPAKAAPAAAKAAAGAKPVKVPNFGRLQRRVMWVTAAVVLGVGYFVAMYMFTSAEVTLYASGTKVSIDTTFKVDPQLKTTDQAGAVLAGQQVSVSKDLGGSFTPTGKKDVGTKASGTVTIQNCEDSNVYPLAAGNNLTSQGLTFVTGEAVTIPAGTFTNGGKNCTSPTVTVPVTAAQNGDKYNLNNASFSTPKLTANFKLTGGQMAGGTTKSVTVVTQGDIDTASAALVAKDKENASRDLAGKVEDGYMQLAASQDTKITSTTSTPAVDSEAESATIALKVNYSVLTVKESEYEALVTAQEQKQVGATNQIYDNGLKTAQVTVADKAASGVHTFQLTTEAYGGTKLDKKDIADKLKGERFGDAMTAAKGLPGVTRADIVIKPAWQSKLPSRPDKITITIQVAEAK